MTAPAPVILFGAFDRHNLGDLLFPHLAAALLRGRELCFAGLAERDLRAHGGHRVQAIARLADAWGERPATLIHVGGELLTCDAWEAAVMLLPPDAAPEAIRRLGGQAQEQERRDWAQRTLGLASLAPYVLARELFAGRLRVIFNAVGGVDLRDREPALRDEVLGKLATADAISVRDSETHAQLATAGIAARLVPDPAVMVAELFGARIRRRARNAAVAEIRAAFDRGYLAVQFSADFGDDATLRAIASQLDRAAAATGFGIVFFRAGAAPWHDDTACYRRLVASMRTASARIFESLNVWDACALIAASRAYCGSSLHARIVALAFAVPRISLRHPAQEGRPSKQAAFVATWDFGGTPAVLNIDDIAGGFERALAADPMQLRHRADDLARRYRDGFLAACDG